MKCRNNTSDDIGSSVIDRRERRSNEYRSTMEVLRKTVWGRINELQSNK